MTSKTVCRWLIVLTCACLVAPLAGTSQPTSARRHLLIVVDGLRPDYVTGDVMPNLTALGKRGVVFRRHHSVYPTVTRVNASSISTGAYPEGHGLLGNIVFFPRVDAAQFLDTADRTNLIKVEQVEGRLLTARTLGEALHDTGRRMLVVSSGSSGSAFLNNHTIAGGAILHPDYVLPNEMREPMKVVGSAPGADAPGDARDRFIVDALLKVGIPRVDPAVTVLWLGALDAAAHANGIGHPTTVDTLRHVDGQIKRIEDGLKAARLFERYNLWVTSDHGFSTYTGAVNVGALLKPFAGSLPDGSPRVVAGGGAIYVRDGDHAATRAIVTALQRASGVGAIFTRESQSGSLDGGVPGTLSFAAARWTHDRSAQILFSPDWTDDTNAHGMRGTSASSGVAGHGSSSPWDIHNTLIAAGPDLKQGLVLDTPSANVDFAATFMTLLGMALPPSVQGRALDEALVGGKAAAANAVRTFEHTAGTADGTYRVTGMFSEVSSGGRVYRYFDGTKVVRK